MTAHPTTTGIGTHPSIFSGLCFPVTYQSKTLQDEREAQFNALCLSISFHLLMLIFAVLFYKLLKLIAAEDGEVVQSQ